jgi:lipoprotein-anchoring transpeptidase ErfK/SrfK
MRRTVLLAVLFGFILAVPTLAEAQIVTKINLSSQRMAVIVDGKARYNWPISTARSGYRTPTGTFKPTALVRYHRSTLYDGSPMPHSIFFLRGYAIHGSYEISISGGRPRMAVSDCIPQTPRRSIRWCSVVGRETR